jgi:hypothetical protein
MNRNREEKRPPTQSSTYSGCSLISHTVMLLFKGCGGVERQLRSLVAYKGHDVEIGVPYRIASFWPASLRLLSEVECHHEHLQEEICVMNIDEKVTETSK